MRISTCLTSTLKIGPTPWTTRIIPDRLRDVWIHRNDVISGSSTSPIC